MFYNSHVNKALTLEWIWSKVIMTAYLSQHSVIPGVSQHFISIMTPWERGSFCSPQERQWGSWRLKDLPKHLCQTLGSLLFCSLAFSFRTLGKQWQSNRKHTLAMHMFLPCWAFVLCVHQSKGQQTRGSNYFLKLKNFCLFLSHFFKSFIAYICGVYVCCVMWSTYGT